MSTENNEQKQFWETVAEKWVTQQGELDLLMAPVLDEVMARAKLTAGERVLDIGCGTGAISMQAADAVGPAGHVLGVDISEPMLERARTLTSAHPNIRFKTADAAHHTFEPARFDAIVSRFGVMFFADSVAAFSNMRRAMKPGARLSMASWSYLDKNPWFQVPMYAAKAQLGAPPRLDPDEPGPLAFRDIKRVCGILAAAGFEKCQGEEVLLYLTPPGDVTQAARIASHVGPASRTMQYFEGTEDDFDAIVARVADEFAVFDSSSGVRVPAAINFFTAKSP